MIRKRLLRAVVIIVVAFVFFGGVLRPVWVSGISMLPTYKSGRPNFCFRLRYSISPPARRDIVFIRMASGRASYLKRLIGLEGDTVEFRDGQLFLNNTPEDEPYAATPCDWNMPPVRVKTGNVYVIGDNRAVSMYDHDFGQTSAKRIMGGPLW